MTMWHEVIQEHRTRDIFFKLRAPLIKMFNKLTEGSCEYTC